MLLLYMPCALHAAAVVADGTSSVFLLSLPAGFAAGVRAPSDIASVGLRIWWVHPLVLLLVPQRPESPLVLPLLLSPAQPSLLPVLAHLTTLPKAAAAAAVAAAAVSVTLLLLARLLLVSELLLARTQPSAPPTPVLLLCPTPPPAPT